MIDLGLAHHGRALADLDDGVGTGQARLLFQLRQGAVQGRSDESGLLEMDIEARDSSERPLGRRIPEHLDFEQVRRW